MNLSEAEAFYKYYNGQAFHMFREEPEKAREFRAFPVTEAMKARWDEDLIADYFPDMREKPAHAWMFQSAIIRVLHRKLCDTARWGPLLLREMDTMSFYNAHNRVMFLENMIGMSQDFSDGGVCYYCTSTDLADEMDRVCRKIMDFNCAEAYPEDKNLDRQQDRLDRAKERYREALAAWKRN